MRKVLTASLIVLTVALYRTIYGDRHPDHPPPQTSKQPYAT